MFDRLFEQYEPDEQETDDQDTDDQETDDQETEEQGTDDQENLDGPYRFRCSEFINNTDNPYGNFISYEYII